MYAKDGGTLPEPVAALSWGYLNANVPSSAELLREINGKALADVYALPAPPKLDAKGQPIPVPSHRAPGTPHRPHRW